jgi:hypothetical protein
VIGWLEDRLPEAAFGTSGSGMPSDDGLPAGTATRARQNLHAADVVFVGDVLDVGTRPPAWSGRAVARQTVRYRVDDWLKGYLDERHVAVDHLVVASSRHADGDAVGLTPTIFAPDKRLIVFVRFETCPDGNRRLSISTKILGHSLLRLRSSDSFAKRLPRDPYQC